MRILTRKRTKYVLVGSDRTDWGRLHHFPGSPAGFTGVDGQRKVDEKERRDEMVGEEGKIGRRREEGKGKSCPSRKKHRVRHCCSAQLATGVARATHRQTGLQCDLTRSPTAWPSRDQQFLSQHISHAFPVTFWPRISLFAKKILVASSAQDFFDSLRVIS